MHVEGTTVDKNFSRTHYELQTLEHYYDCVLQLVIQGHVTRNKHNFLSKVSLPPTPHRRLILSRQKIRSQKLAVCLTQEEEFLSPALLTVTSGSRKKRSWRKKANKFGQYNKEVTTTMAVVDIL